MQKEFIMWTLLVLCSVITSYGVRGIVHYFLIVMFVYLVLDSVFFSLAFVFLGLVVSNSVSMRLYIYFPWQDFRLSLVFKWLMYSDLLSYLFVFFTIHQVLIASKRLMEWIQKHQNLQVQKTTTKIKRTKMPRLYRLIDVLLISHGFSQQFQLNQRY